MHQELKGVWDTFGLKKRFSERDRSSKGPVFLYFPSYCRIPDPADKTPNKGSPGHVSWLLDTTYLSHIGDATQIVMRGKAITHYPWSEEKISNQSVKINKNTSLRKEIKGSEVDYLYAEMGNKLNMENMEAYAKTNILYKDNLYAIADTEAIEDGKVVDFCPRNNCVTQSIELFLAGLADVKLSKEFTKKHSAFEKYDQNESYVGQINAGLFNEYMYPEQVAQIVTDFWTAHE